MNNKLKVITFSGVDGAGKSTIIKIIKSKLERKGYDIIQLRSRPQIFPILSSFSYGKKNAEDRATKSMPRTGNNISTISSLLRLMYYFLDYLIGQIYISFKYRKSSTIIIYDRYFYDYIVDPKRSNICLPESIIKPLYKFIFKPNLNIFLYAPAIDILKRKRELDEVTINYLTCKYKNLFIELDKNSRENYVAIENTLLERTISDIMNTINKNL